MDKENPQEYELFLTKMRWLTILGIPSLMWFQAGTIPLGIILLSAIFLINNVFIELYLIKNHQVSKYLVFLSLLDASYLVLIYLQSPQEIENMNQLFYFLILILGIRHGNRNYKLVILSSILLFVGSSLINNYYSNNPLQLKEVFKQVLFFTAFGFMISFLIKNVRKQQKEKEKLIQQLTSAYEQLCVYNAQVEELANRDPLTGLYNYRFFMERLNTELELSKKFNYPLSLIIIDIDHFKEFNDTYGHPAGDIVLKKSAEIFSQNIRDNDTLCRYGGEEFLILLPCTKIEEAYKCAERIRKAIETNRFTVENQSVNITISGGVACFPDDALSGEDLLKIADYVLYSAKLKGRNKIHRTI